MSDNLFDWTFSCFWKKQNKLKDQKVMELTHLLVDDTLAGGE
jgi:hypothetical protein